MFELVLIYRENLGHNILPYLVHRARYVKYICVLRAYKHGLMQSRRRIIDRFHRWWADQARSKTVDVL